MCLLQQQLPRQPHLPQPRHIAQRQPTSASPPRRPDVTSHQAHLKTQSQPSTNDNNRYDRLTKTTKTRTRHDIAQTTRHRANDTTTRKRRPAPTKTTHDHRVDSDERRQRGKKTDDDNEAPPTPTTTNGDDEATPMPTITNGVEGAAHQLLSRSRCPTSTFPLPLCSPLPLPSLASRHSLPLP